AAAAAAGHQRQQQQPPLVKSSSEDSDDIQLRDHQLLQHAFPSDATVAAAAAMQLVGQSTTLQQQPERMDSRVSSKGDRADPERAFKIPGELHGGTEAPYYMTYPLCAPHLVQVTDNGNNSKHPHPDIKLDPTPYAAAAPVGFSRDSAIATTMCGDRPLCAHKIMDSEESVYGSLYKVPEASNESESKLNHLFMGAVSIKPRVGERPFRYEMAKKEQMKSTHSSFWFVSLRQRELITERAAASAMMNTQISLDDAAVEFHAAREAAAGAASVAVKEEQREEEMMDTSLPPTDAAPAAAAAVADHRAAAAEAVPPRAAGSSSLSGREAKDLSMDEDLTAIVEEKRRAMERAKEEEEHEAAIHAAKEHTMASLGLKSGGEKRRKRDETSVDRMSIGDITTLLELSAEEMTPMVRMQSQRDPVIGGYKTDEVYVYVRGRGRGRYVCERCGIRCKKPSMLKKHIKSHTDVRPYQCLECNFSFKTKGNLTKHLASKAHRRKTTPTEGMGSDSLPSARSLRRRSEIDVVGSDSDDDEEDERMDEGGVDDDVTKEMDIHMDNDGSDDDFDDLDDGEEDENMARGHLPSADRHPYHKFGQEQILIERRAHTPPTCWGMPEREKDQPQWPDNVHTPRGYCRRCTSAPPTVQWKTKKKGRGGEEEEEGEESLEGGGEREKRGESRMERRRKRRADIRGHNESAASSKGSGEERRGESRGSEKGGGGGGSVGLYAQAQQFSPSDVLLSMTSSTLAPQQAGRSQLAMNNSPYPNAPMEIPRLASALPPSASSLLAAGGEQLQQAAAVAAAAAALLPATAAAAAAGLIPVQTQGGSSTAGPSSSSAAPLGSYQMETEEMKCGDCDRVFRKVSDYTMHVHTHNLEKSKMRLLYSCSECKASHKTKQQLLRHMEVAHPLLAAAARGGGAAADESAARQRSSSSCSSAVGSAAAAAAAASMPSGSGLGQETPIEQTILSVTNSLTNNPRSFVCLDCNIGFRKHGILAKHLRSKTHVMKLETAKLLPEDSLTLITKRDNGTCLNEVDTTSCETARRSILRIVDRIRQENVAAAASVQVQALPSQTNGPISVEERRLVVPISALHPAASAADPLAATAAALFAQQQQRGGASSTTTSFDLLKQQLELLSAAHHRSLAGALSDPPAAPAAATTAAATATVASAAVWMPPRVEEVQQTAASAAAALAAASYSSASAQPAIHRRPSFDANGYLDRLGNGHSSTAVTPPALTRCGVCEMNFENPMDHQIHAMTDHIVMRDGHDFACPRPNCDKVYPDRETLRTHILAHFRHYDREEESAAAAGGLVGRLFGAAAAAGGGEMAAAAAAAAKRRDTKEEGEASASDEDTMEMEGGGEESSCPSRASSIEGGLRIAEDDEEEESAAAAAAA
ncbi:hypothetical protein PFISCL1PPCAC_23572, partial [Pristionchus fissidentatus]